MPSEQELIERSRAGDREAFAELIRQYGDRIYRLAQQVCARAPAEADGVHQETFVTALEKIQQFENRSALGTWLYRIAANLCFMRLRNKHHSATESLDTWSEKRGTLAGYTRNVRGRDSRQPEPQRRGGQITTASRAALPARETPSLFPSQTAIAQKFSMTIVIGTY